MTLAPSGSPRALPVPLERFPTPSAHSIPLRRQSLVPARLCPSCSHSSFSQGLRDRKASMLWHLISAIPLVAGRQRVHGLCPKPKSRRQSPARQVGSTHIRPSKFMLSTGSQVSSPVVRGHRFCLYGVPEAVDPRCVSAGQSVFPILDGAAIATVVR